MIAGTIVSVAGPARSLISPRGGPQDIKRAGTCRDGGPGAMVYVTTAWPLARLRSMKLRITSAVFHIDFDRWREIPNAIS